MSKASSPESGAVAVQRLDGVWFRRERERIAMGRKPLAGRLGIPEHRLVMVERHTQEVPAEWLGALTELGFRIPQQVPAVSQVGPTLSTEAAMPEPTAAIPISAPTASSPDLSDLESGAAAVVASASNLRVTKPSKEVDKSMTSSVGIKNQDTETPRATSSEPGGAAFHGYWLRERRLQKGVRTADVASQIGGPPADINTVERNNLRLPLVWIPSLLKLKLLTVPEAKAAMQMPSDKSSRMNGKWIREQRLQRQLKPADVASKLGTSRLDVELIETRNWLIPTEWLQPLSELFASSKSAKGKKSDSSGDSAAKKDSAANQPTAPAKEAKAKAKETAKVKEKAKETAKVKEKAKAKETAAPKEAAPPATKAPAQAASKPKTVKPAKVKPETVKPSTQAAATLAHGELSEAVVRYRLMLGERAGLSAVEVLAQIASDLQMMLGKDALSYERLRAAMRVLTSQ
jgi:transcriptional regulator with XRE-family HTH domain